MTTVLKKTFLVLNLTGNVQYFKKSDKDLFTLICEKHLLLDDDYVDDDYP